MYLPQTRRVHLGGGATSRLELAVDANFGSLAISSDPPGASIVLDGDDTGKQTPATLERVPTGTHEARLQSPTHAAGMRRVTLGRGGSEALSFDMKPRLGRLKLTAEVVDGDVREPR